MHYVHADPRLIAAVGPRIRKSPFFDCTVRAGLSAVSCYNHMWLPMSYGDPDSEYRRITETVSMWDVAAQRHLRVSGPAADDIVQYVTTIDTADIAVGHAAYAPMVRHDGVLINDPILLHVGSDDWRFSLADADIGLWLEAVSAERGTECVVGELDTATLAVQGPGADEVMKQLELDVGGLDDLQMCHVVLDGMSLIVSRSGWSNAGGYEIFLDDSSSAERLWARVESAGDQFGIGPAAPNPSERIENVLLSYGTDTGYDATPIELGLDGSIDLDGDDFIGRQALRDIRAAGTERHLMGVVIHGGRIDTLPHPAQVSSGAEVLGELRAAAWSPRFRANLGLALLRSDVDAGVRGSAMLPSGLHGLTVVELPFAESDVAPLR